MLNAQYGEPPTFELLLLSIHMFTTTFHVREPTPFRSLWSRYATVKRNSLNMDTRLLLCMNKKKACISGNQDSIDRKMLVSARKA